MVDDLIQRLFPRLHESSHRITSSQSVFYNCIAWAAGDTGKFWWPDDLFLCFWPQDAPREVTMRAFISAFSRMGYEPCEKVSVESGLEKVAIYRGSDGRPTHMARQLESGAWTSKLGKLEDIEHTLEGLEGSDYGSVAVFMKRPRPLK